MLASQFISTFCLIVLAILLFGILMQKNNYDESAKRFCLLVYSVFGFLIVSMLSDYAEGNPARTGIAFFLDYLGFLAADAVVIMFTYYLSVWFADADKKTRRLFYLSYVFSCIRIVVVFILTVTGNLFEIDSDGYYNELELAFIPYAFSTFIMIWLIITIFVNKARFSSRELIVIIVYLVLPVVPIVLELLTDVYSLTGAAMTLSVLLIYVLIQAVTIENGKTREYLLEEISSTDLLTGLRNRRAYYKRITAVKPQHNYGIVFCDINKLKYTNDHFGHVAGDTLIKKFADMLTKHFDGDEVYRISGDEFIVVVSKTANEDFCKKVEAFRTVIIENDNISSIGYSYGIGSCMEHLVSEAETFMYEDKRAHSVQRG